MRVGLNGQMVGNDDAEIYRVLGLQTFAVWRT